MDNQNVEADLEWNTSSNRNSKFSHRYGGRFHPIFSWNTLPAIIYSLLRFRLVHLWSMGSTVFLGFIGICTS